MWPFGHFIIELCTAIFSFHHSVEISRWILASGNNFQSRAAFILSSASLSVSKTNEFFLFNVLGGSPMPGASQTPFSNSTIYIFNISSDNFPLLFRYQPKLLVACSIYQSNLLALALILPSKLDKSSHFYLNRY